MVFGGIFSVFSVRPRPHVQPEPSIPYLGFVRLAPPFDTYLGELPADMSVPSMITELEKRFLYHLARDYYVGEGYIVDAGIFLGASTYCFGAGVRDNPRCAEIEAKQPRPVISLEKGIVTPTMIKALNYYKIEPELAVGESFAPVLERNIAPIRRYVRLRLGDVMEHGRAVGPIEILFLDLIKQENVAHFVVGSFFRKLIPGRSIVIQQDYFFDGLEYLKPFQEYFSDKFEFVGEIGSSAVFRCIAPIAMKDISRFRTAMQDGDFRLRLARAANVATHDPARQILMSVSLVRLTVSLKGPQAGADALASLERDFAATLADPNLPQRVHDAVNAARFLCSSKGKKRDLIHAQMIALGHAPAGDAAAG
jgi:hypothetical protein